MNPVSHPLAAPWFPRKCPMAVALMAGVGVGIVAGVCGCAGEKSAGETVDEPRNGDRGDTVVDLETASIEQLDALIGALDDPSPRRRGYAAQKIGSFGHAAISAVDALIRRLGDEAPFTVSTLYHTDRHLLRRFDPDADDPSIIPDKRDGDDLPGMVLRATVREWVIAALIAIGDATVAAVVEVFATDDALAVDGAVTVISQISPLPIRAMIEALAQPSRRRAAAQVIEITPHSLHHTEFVPEVVTALVGALADDSEAVRTTALMALRRFGERAAPALNAVTNALADDSAAVRETAAVVLASFGSAAVSAAEPLARVATTDAVPGVRGAALGAWVRVVADASPIDAIFAALRDPTLPEESASRALTVLVARVPGAIAKLDAETWAGFDDRARLGTLKAIAPLGASMRETWPLVAETITATPIELRVAGVQTLIALRLDAATAIPLLLGAAESSDPILRQTALRGIVEFGPEAVVAVPALLALPSDETALIEIGPPAFPALFEAYATVDDGRRLRIAQFCLAHRLAVTPLIVAKTADANPVVRERALRLVAVLVREIWAVDAEMAAVVARGLSDAQATVCAAAAGIAGEWRVALPAEFVDLLIAVFALDDPIARANAVRGLARIGITERSDPVVAKIAMALETLAVSDPDANVRQHAEQARAQIRTLRGQ